MPQHPRILSALTLAALVLGAGCSTGQKLQILASPADADLTVTRAEDGRRVSVRPVRDRPGVFTARLDFKPNAQEPASFTVTALPRGETATSHRSRSVRVDTDLYRTLPEGKDMRLLAIEMPPARTLPPVMMRIRFSGVRVTFPLSRSGDSAGEISGEPIKNEWEDIRAGIRQELAEARGPMPDLQHVLDEMERIDLPDVRFETGNEARLRDRVTRFYTVPLEVLMPSLEPATELVSKIAGISGRYVDGSGAGVSVPEFTPVDASIEFRTTFVDSLLSITVEGVAPIGASVYLFDHETEERFLVERESVATAWAAPFSVAPGRRYIYGISEETVNGAVLNKAFRIDIFTQRTEEIPFSQLERLRRTAR